MRILTTLEKFESLGNVALVAHKEKTPLRRCLFLLLLARGDFGTERDALPQNAMDFGAGEIGTRIGLANMCCERAAFLAVRVKAKVIVTRNICPEFGVILERGDIDGCPFPNY